MFNYLNNSNYVVLARYEEGSNTVRKVPENYCLIKFDFDGEPQFDIDGASVPYRHLVKEGYQQWLSSFGDSQHRLAALVSIALKGYIPFSQYPSWNSFDVQNALYQLKYMASSPVDGVDELKDRYRELSSEIHEMEHNDLSDGDEIKLVLNEHVAEIRKVYENRFSHQIASATEVNVFVPMISGLLQQKPTMFVGPHSREEAEASFHEHTNVFYTEYVQAEDKNRILESSDTVGSYIERSLVSNNLDLETKYGNITIVRNSLGTPSMMFNDGIGISAD